MLIEISDAVIEKMMSGTDLEKIQAVHDIPFIVYEAYKSREAYIAPKNIEEISPIQEAILLLNMVNFLLNSKNGDAYDENKDRFLSYSSSFLERLRLNGLSS